MEEETTTRNTKGLRMKESLIKYLAGILDADGCLSFMFTQDRLREDCFALGLSLALSSSTAVDRHGFMQSLPVDTGFGAITTSGEEQQFLTWQVRKSSHLEMLLPRLIKHMVIKAKYWQWLLDTWRERRSVQIGQRSVSLHERQELSRQCKERRASMVGPIRPKNHPTWGWLAGYLDGDGCYYFRETSRRKNRFPCDYVRVFEMRVSCACHVNDASVLEFIHKAFGGMIGNQTETVKVWYRTLGASNKSFALNFLPNLVKHSRLKKHKIEMMISIHNTLIPHQQRLSIPTPAGEATV
jgi:hypothetical protein